MPELPEYHGIKQGYPRLRRYFGKLAGYIQLCRGFTLLAPLLAGLFGVLAPVEVIRWSQVVVAVYVGVTLAACQAVGQCVNQYVDAPLDSKIKDYRPIPSGLVSREEALGLAWLLSLFAVGRAFTLGVFFGLTVLVVLFFAVFYSLAPFSPRQIHPFLNTGWTAVSRGFIPMFAVFSVYGSVHQAWVYGWLAFLWVMGFQAAKDIPDKKGDKKFGIKTIPNTYGSPGITATMICSTVLFAVVSLIFHRYAMLPLVALAAVVIPLKDRKIGFMENNVGWIGLYLGLSAIYILVFWAEHNTF